MPQHNDCINIYRLITIYTSLCVVHNNKKRMETSTKTFSKNENDVGLLQDIHDERKRMETSLF